MEKFTEIWILSLIILPFFTASATQFTFDLEDSAEQCFYESIKENTFCTLEFYVSTVDLMEIVSLSDGMIRVLL